MSSITLDMTDDAGFILRLPLAYEPCRPPYKYASHPYPVFSQDFYTASVTADSVVVTTVVFPPVVYAQDDLYAVSVAPLDVVVHDITARYYDAEAYSVSASALEVSVTTVVHSINMSDNAYTVLASPLDLAVNSIVIRYAEEDVYTVSASPLDININTI